MRTLPMILTAALVWSCSNVLEPSGSQEVELSQKSLAHIKARKNKVTICHDGKSLEVSQKGWERGHSKHKGDHFGPCTAEQEVVVESEVEPVLMSVATEAVVATPADPVSEPGYEYFQIEVDGVGPGGVTDTVILTEASFGTWIPVDDIHTYEATSGDLSEVHTALYNMSGNSANGKLLFTKDQLPWRYKLKCGKRYTPGHLTIKAYELQKYHVPGRVKLMASNDGVTWKDILDFYPPDAQNAFTPALVM